MFDLIPDLCRVALSAVLTLAGVAKLMDVSAFSRTLHTLGMFPKRANRALAVALPSIELLLGVALAVGTNVPLAAAFAGILFVAFSLVLARILLKKRTVNCACFGNLSRSRVTRWSIVRNGVLTVLSWVVAVLSISTKPALIVGVPALLVVAAIAATGLIAGEIAESFRFAGIGVRTVRESRAESADALHPSAEGRSM